MDDGEETARLSRPSRWEVLFEMLQRGMALLCLAFGLLYWVRLIGLAEDAGWRFDIMPAHWQAASVALAVLYPFAGIGLWMLASWGLVVWFLCAAAETAMHGAMPQLFGERHAVLAAHAVTALLLFGLKLAILRRRRLAEVSAR